MNSNLSYYTDKAYKLFHDGILALQDMEQQGFRINRKYIARKNEELQNQIKNLESDFKATKFFRAWQHSMKSDVNIYSAQQLGNFLYKVKKITPPKFTDTGAGSTDDEALAQLGIPELDILLQIKKIKKIKKTYLDAFLREQVNGVVHPSFDLHLVKTFRGSSSNPNWQNLPKRDKEAMDIVRGAVYPRRGFQLLELDYSQLEVRIAACYHKDPVMIKYIKDPTTDMHRDMAQQLFKLKTFDKSITGHSTLRQAAKNGFVFPEFYGDYFANCATNLTVNWGKLPKTGIWKPGQGIPLENAALSDHMIKNKFNSLEKYAEYVRAVEKDFWGSRFKVYASWRENWYKEYLKNGYVQSFTGFTFQGNMSRNDTINYPVQGAAFHVLLWSLIEGNKAFKTEKMKSKIIAQIHDALVIDVYPPELNKVVAIMKCIMMHDVRQVWEWITVPLDIEAELCDVDASWSKKHEFNIH